MKLKDIKMEWVKVNDFEDEEIEAQEGEEELPQQGGMFLMPSFQMKPTPIQGRMIDWLYDRLNKYELHINLKIYSTLFDLIKECDGVEGICQLTPYRILVAFGRMFDDERVQVEIKRAIEQYVKNEPRKQLH